MRSLVVLILAGVLVICSVVHAETTPEDTVEAAADEFIKAFIAGDADSAVKTIGIPFVAVEIYPQGHVRFETLEQRDEANAYVEGMIMLSREKGMAKFTFVGARAVPLADIRKNMPDDEYHADLNKKMIEAAGADGFVVVSNADVKKSDEQLGILTRFHDGTAKVVGLVLVSAPTDCTVNVPSDIPP